VGGKGGGERKAREREEKMGMERKEGRDQDGRNCCAGSG